MGYEMGWGMGCGVWGRVWGVGYGVGYRYGVWGGVWLKRMLFIGGVWDGVWGGVWLKRMVARLKMMHYYVHLPVMFKFSHLRCFNCQYVIESSIYLHRWPVMKNLSGTNL